MAEGLSELVWSPSDGGPSASYTLRLAGMQDVPALGAIIAASARALQVEDYDADQIESAIGTVFGVDRRLIEDGSYFAVECDGALAGCGGWSRRHTLYGADAAAARDDGFLQPGLDAAKIRAFFVHPAHARRGVGEFILRASEAAAAAAGFTRLELGATLTGLGFYGRRGYAAAESSEAPLPSGRTLTIVRMVKSVRTHAQNR